MGNQPSVSVIIPVYNREKYIGGAIQSVLNQTWKNVDLIVVNDGSTDHTREVVESFDDKRIRLLSYQDNRGISHARNVGLEYARGKYIAWLDSDDIAYPHRLNNQVRFLEKNEKIAMVGACAGLLDSEGQRLKGVRIPPFNSDDIKAWLLFRTAFQQSSICGRTEILKRYPYREELPVCEDYDVNIRISRDHQICNLPKILIDRRIHAEQSIQLNKDAVTKENILINREQLNQFGVDCSYSEAVKHVLLSNSLKYWNCQPDHEFLSWAENWLISLRKTNLKNGYVDQRSLDFSLGYFWSKICLLSCATLGFRKVFREYLTSSVFLGGLSSNCRSWLLHVISIEVTSSLKGFAI